MNLALPDFSSNRFEIKYLVPVRDLQRIKDRLADMMVADQHHGDLNDGYFNHSIYFDTPDFGHYFQKHEGMNQRMKVRMRVHRDSPDGPPTRIFLELKHRLGRIVKKDRHPLDEKAAEALLAHHGVSGLDLDPDHAGETPNPVLPAFYYLVKRFTMRPVVSILYHRAAFHMPLYPNVRITFDTGVKASSLTGLSIPLSSFRPCLDPRHAVIELKYFRSVPRLITRRFNELGLNQVTLSKYAVGIETIFQEISRFHHQGDRLSRERPGIG